MSVHRPTISEIEAGRRRVHAEELIAFAKIYRVSVAWLIAEDAPDDLLDAKVQLAARKLSKLRREDLKQVLDILSSLPSGEEDNE